MFASFCSNINCKKVAITTFVVFVYIVATDFIIHQLIMKPMYAETAALWRPEAEIRTHYLWMLLGQLGVAKIFSLLFAKGYEGRGMMEGVRFGLLMGGFVASQVFIQYAVMPITCALACGWFFAYLIQMTLAGVVASFVYKR